MAPRKWSRTYNRFRLPCGAAFPGSGYFLFCFVSHLRISMLYHLIKFTYQVTNMDLLCSSWSPRKHRTHLKIYLYVFFSHVAGSLSQLVFVLYLEFEQLRFTIRGFEPCLLSQLIWNLKYSSVWTEFGHWSHSRYYSLFEFHWQDGDMRSCVVW